MATVVSGDYNLGSILYNGGNYLSTVTPNYYQYAYGHAAPNNSRFLFISTQARNS